MVTILLHSSKTTRTPVSHGAVTGDTQIPALYHEVAKLEEYLKSLSPNQIQKAMALSEAMAHKTLVLTKGWSDANPTLPAIDLFLGDIYSGLQAQTFALEDREYANNHLFILSGLYGILRALDEIQPYRLEMGYKLPGNTHDPSQPNITNLYEFWGDKIAKALPESEVIINLSAVEYTKAVFPHFKNLEKFNNSTIITPKFLTISPKTGEPTFVTVHAKIARGAFARWLIHHRIEDLATLKDFNDIGYTYNAELSTPEQPVFVAQEFKGLGLSIRLSKTA